MLYVNPPPPSLDEALAFVDELRARPDATAALMTEELWERAMTVAKRRRDREHLATLLRSQLVPALSRAMISLAHAADQVNTAGSVDESLYERVYRLGRIVHVVLHDVLRAAKVTWAAELYTGSPLGRPRPMSISPVASAYTRVKESEYVQIHVDGYDVLQALAEDLEIALRFLSRHVRAAVEVVDRDELDDLLAQPLQHQVFMTFHVLTGVRKFLFTVSTAEALRRRMHEDAPG